MYRVSQNNTFIYPNYYNIPFQVEFNNTRRLCHRCWQRVDNAVRPAAPEIQNPPDDGFVQEQIPDVLPLIEVPEYIRAPNTSRHCIFNICQNERYHKIPETIKVHMLSEYKLYIPPAARVTLHYITRLL